MTDSRSAMNFRSVEAVDSADTTLSELPQKMGRILLRNNLIALAIHLIIGCSLALTLFFEEDASGAFSVIAQAIIGALFLLSIFAFIVYPLLAFFLLEPLPRRNYLSVAAPAVLILLSIIFDLIAGYINPHREFSLNIFNHISTCGFCHALGPGFFVDTLTQPGAVFGWMFESVGGGYNSLPVLLVVAFYPSLLLYIGLALRVGYKKGKEAAQAVVAPEEIYPDAQSTSDRIFDLSGDTEEGEGAQ